MPLKKRTPHKGYDYHRYFDTDVTGNEPRVLTKQYLRRYADDTHFVYTVPDREAFNEIVSASHRIAAYIRINKSITYVVIGNMTEALSNYTAWQAAGMVMIRNLRDLTTDDYDTWLMALVDYANDNDADQASKDRLLAAIQQA